MHNLKLDEEQEKQLSELGYSEWKRYPAIKNEPLRAIVKEYFPPEIAPFTLADMPRMKSDIIELNKLGIINPDIREPNYRRGHLLDFSVAMVTPHKHLDWHSKIYLHRDVKELCVVDRVYFDILICDWNLRNPDQYEPFFPGNFREQRKKKRLLRSLRAEGSKLCRCLLRLGEGETPSTGKGKRHD